MYREDKALRSPVRPPSLATSEPIESRAKSRREGRRKRGGSFFDSDSTASVARDSSMPLDWTTARDPERVTGAGGWGECFWRKACFVLRNHWALWYGPPTRSISSSRAVQLGAEPSPAKPRSSANSRSIESQGYPWPVGPACECASPPGSTPGLDSQDDFSAKVKGGGRALYHDCTPARPHASSARCQPLGAFVPPHASYCLG
ncbi:hypothetical protein C8R44DRAFT_866683 [Mycena epipterygia]|nr:hypothetical protein C8R44DRAFT_866683 [Mycena epipterygia]